MKSAKLLRKSARIWQS